MTHFICNEKQGPVCGARVCEITWSGTYDRAKVNCLRCRKSLRRRERFNRTAHEAKGQGE